MDNVTRSAQGLDCLGTKQAMGIGDDADQDRQFSVLSTQFSALSSQHSVLSTQFSALSSQHSVLSSRYSLLHLLNKASDAYDGSANSTTANFLDLVARSHTQSVEASVKRLQHGFRLDARADATRGAVLDVDRSSHSNFVAFAVWLQREKGRGLHQTDHVGRGVNRRQLRMVRGQR